MDWVFSGGANRAQGPTTAARAAAALVEAQIRRHSPELAQAEAASRLAAEMILEAGSGAGSCWVELDWERAQPVLTVRHIPRFTQLPTAPAVPEGVWVPDEYVAELAELFRGAGTVSAELPVGRSPELDVSLPPVPLVGQVEPAGYAGHVAGTLVAQGESGASMLEAAAAAGTGASQAALDAYVRSHNGAVPRTPGQVAQAFADFVNASGADFFAVEGGEDSAVLVNRACPFGGAVEGRRSVCRATTSLLGSLGARANGRAEVVLSEAIAAGDPRCHVLLRFTPTGSPWAQRYEWPPATRDAGDVTQRGLRVALSLQLPRDKLSVSLLGHLVAHVLEEVGVLPDDRADVELAVTEAAAIVTEHSGAGDAYEVTVTIGPALAELRVVDMGRGFDHVLLSEVVAGRQDERGRGLALMNALIDQVRFVSAPERGTVVHLVKRLRFDDSAPARRLMLSGAGRESSQGPYAAE